MSNDTEKLLSIKEFAAAAGVSKQAIYSQLESRLKPYVVKVDNVKKIKESALEKFYSSQLESSIQSSFNQVEQPKEDTAAAAAFDKVLDTLSKQLETKDKQIEELNRRLAEMSNIVQQQQVLLDQQQKLTLVEKKDDIKEIAAAADQPQKKGFFSKLFNN